MTPLTVTPEIPEQPQQARADSRLRQAGAIVLGCLLAFVTVEAVCRQMMFGLSKSYDVDLNRIVHPPGTTRYGLEGRGVTTWGPHGVRNKSSWKPGGILCLGDSLTESIQVDDREAFTALLETELNRRIDASDQKIDVLNLGFAGMGIADHIGYAPRSLDVFQPAWTIIQLSDNDFLASEAVRPKNCQLVENSDGSISVTVPKLGPLFGSVARESLATTIGETCATIPFAYARYREYVTACARSPEPPLFFGAEETAPQDSSEDPAVIPVEAALDQLVNAYGGRLSILYLSNFQLARPDERSPVEARVFAACRNRHVSFVSTRAANRHCIDSHQTIYGFHNGPFGRGHLNAFGHQVVAAILSPVMRRTPAIARLLDSAPSKNPIQLVEFLDELPKR